jgi:hypothetical protein
MASTIPGVKVPRCRTALLNPMQQVVTFSGRSTDPRLSPQEIEDLANFAFLIHNHDASTPALPIFWHRADCDLSRYWN